MEGFRFYLSVKRKDQIKNIDISVVDRVPLQILGFELHELVNQSLNLHFIKFLALLPEWGFKSETEVVWTIQLIDAIRVKLFVLDVFLAINCALVHCFIINEGVSRVGLSI